MLENLTVNFLYPALDKDYFGTSDTQEEEFHGLASYPFLSFYFLYLYMSWDITFALWESKACCQMSI